MNDPTKPNYQSDEFTAMLPIWAKVDCVYGGTEAMRTAKIYLPQFPLEDDSTYKQRLEVSTFFPGYRDTLDGLTGTIFRKPIQLGDKVPQAIKNDLENIDNAGTHYEVFGQRLFRTGVHHGEAFVLVDMPQEPAVDVLDASQAQAINFRPFWQIYSGDELANEPRYVIIEGAPVLQQIVFCEESVKLDGFGESCVERYRVWKLPVLQDAQENYHRAGKAEWEIYEKQEDAKTKEEVFILLDSGVSPLDDIPVSIFNANPCLNEPMESDGPVLLDLANLNIKLYQQESDHESNLHLCTPIPFTVNMKQESDGSLQPGKLAWGSGVIFHMDTGGTAGYMEPRGTGLVQRENWILGIRKQMLELGLALAQEGSQQQGGAMTATEAMLKGGTRASRLTQLARAFQDCFEQALVFTAQWKGLWTGVEDEAEITMGVKDADLVLSAQDLTILSTMVEKGQHSLKYLWSNEARAGLQPDDFTPEQEMKDIEADAKLKPATAPPVMASGFTQPFDPAKQKPAIAPAAAQNGAISQ